MREHYLRFCDGLAAVIRPLVMGLMLAMTVDVLLGVFFRYVIGNALTWTEESARYMMIWMGFLATSLALREGGHVSMDVFLNQLPRRSRRGMLVVIRLLCVLYLLTVVGTSVVLLKGVSSQCMPVLALSMLWAYLAIPIGCLLTAFEAVALILRDPDGVAARTDIRSSTERDVTGQSCC